jgi:hypothetical protein
MMWWPTIKAHQICGGRCIGMRHWLFIMMVGVVCALWGQGAFATEFVVSAGIGPGFPVGDFGKTANIVGADEAGSYNATGGGAENNFGFDLGLEARVSPRVSIGAMFGYRPYNAEVADILEEVVKPLIPEVKRLDAKWKYTLLGGYIRLDAYSGRAWRTYLRGSLGVANIKNSFEVDFGTSDITSRTVSADFDLGNRLYMSGCVGGEYALRAYVTLFVELDFHQFLTDGAEASADVGDYTLQGTEKFNAQVAGVMFGVKIPFNAF